MEAKVEYNKDIIQLYQHNLSNHIQFEIKKTLKLHKLPAPVGEVNAAEIVKIKKMLAKKNKKLIIAIWTSDTKRDIAGNSFIYKKSFCEIVKKGLKKGTFVNMIKKRFDEVKTTGTWEVADYGR